LVRWVRLVHRVLRAIRVIPAQRELLVPLVLPVLLVPLVLRVQREILGLLVLLVRLGLLVPLDLRVLLVLPA
jgi:hypothetical protein